MLRWLKLQAIKEFYAIPPKQILRLGEHNHHVWLRYIEAIVKSEGGHMATQKKNEAVAWVGFVNIVLNDNDKQIFAAWDMEMDDCWDFMMLRCVEGYKLSVTYNEGNKSYVCSLTCNTKSDPNAGYTLSAFAPDVATAIRVLAFKDEVLAAHGEWPRDKNTSGGIG